MSFKIDQKAPLFIQNVFLYQQCQEPSSSLQFQHIPVCRQIWLRLKIIIAVTKGTSKPRLFTHIDIKVVVFISFDEIVLPWNRRRYHRIFSQVLHQVSEFVHEQNMQRNRLH